MAVQRRIAWGPGVAVLALGIMLGTLIRVQRAVEGSAAPDRAVVLGEQLLEVERERDALMEELEQARARLAMVSSPETQDELREARVAAGLTPVTGPGITVTMNDSLLPTAPGQNVNNYIIHDEDVLQVLNVLKRVGAEAISINGQRLIAYSEVRCAGPTVIVNGVRTTVPIVITAVGPAKELASALEDPKGIAAELRRWGIEVSAKEYARIEVPAYRGSLRSKYARPAASSAANQ